MGPLDAAVHLLNFFVPALALGGFGAAFAKLLWRRELKAVTWRRLSGWGSAGAVLALVAGLMLFGHDGKVATYAAMVFACAAGQWWAGFGPRARRSL